VSPLTRTRPPPSPLFPYTTLFRSMRLGSYPCVLTAGTLAATAYGTREIQERHRHRYEVNNDYTDALVGKGMRISGTSPDRHLVRSEEHTSELQSLRHLVCRLLLEK